jgi:hypothetical protein
MPRLIVCRSCGEHIRSEETACPHCGTHVRDEQSMLARGAGAVVLGLALAGCPSDDDDDPSSNTSVEPEYGVPATDSVTDPTTGGSMSTTASSQSETVGEPEYGVPETGFPEDSGTSSGGESTSDTGSSDGSTSIEPDYGVPETSNGG